MSMSVNNKTRVLHIITRLIRGGADENTVHTVEGLKKHGYNVHLLIGGQSELDYANSVNGARVIVLPELVREIEPFKDMIALIKIIRLLRAQKYDIVHTHTAKGGMLGRLAGKLCKIPVVVHTVHGTTFHDSLHPLSEKIYRNLERLAAHATHTFVTVGDDLRDRYVAAGIASPDRFVTIRSGFDLHRFKISEEDIRYRYRNCRESLGFSKDDIIIGTVSRLEPRKGHHFLLEAARTVVMRNPRAIFVITGDGNHSDFLHMQADALEISDNVRFLGHRSDIEDVICCFDIFVLTSLWEGLPRVLVQSAALGKPIVTFDVEGAREIVREGVNGFVVPLRDVDKLVQRIEYLVSDLARAQQMGRAGRSRVTSDWDVSVMTQKIIDLYQNLTDKSENYALA